jgi:hypothetical protein
MAFLSAISTARQLRVRARGGAIGSLLALALLGAPLAGAPPPPVPPPEYQIKAVFLFNFTQFVEWPASAFADPAAPLIIGVLGEDPFGAQLDDAVRDEKIGLRPLVVRRYQRVDEIAECHLLFISGSEAGQLPKIMARLKGRSMLTVGDTAGFNRLGGMVRFVTENNKIRLRINVEAAKAAGLVLSSKLLRPAMIFNPEKD